MHSLQELVAEQGRLAPFLSRTADSLLYVPLVIPSILGLDTRINQAAIAAADGDEGKGGGDSSEEEEEEEELRVVAATQTVRGRTTLRWILLAAAVAVAAALIAPFMGSVVAGPALCFRADDLAATPEACHEGIDVMAKLDRHTRTLYAGAAFGRRP